MIRRFTTSANGGRRRAVLSAALSLCLGLIAQQANAQVTWGSDYAVENIPTDINGYSSVVASTSNIGVIESGGRVRCWGEADDNQNIVPDGLKAKYLAAGQYYFAAVAKDGHVLCWGNNGFGQCDVPAGLTNVVSVAAGASQVIAVKDDGTTVTWGDKYGSWHVPSMSNVKQVSAFFEHYIFVKRNGSVYDQDGNLQGSNAKAAAAGRYHTVILHSDGTVACTGENGQGQCDVPAGLTGVRQVAAGGDWSMALKSDGSIVTWGANDSGQLNAPTDKGYSDIAVGGAFAIAIKPVQISIDPRVIGGQSGIGTIFLSNKAPAGGQTVSLSSDNSLVTIPASVTIPEGFRTASFAYDASVPTSDTDVVLTATDSLTSMAATATIRVTMPSVTSFVNVDTFVGGSDRHIVLEIDVPNPAVAAGLPVTLASDNAAVTVPASATIRRGQRSVKVVIEHELVHANTDVTITYSIPGATNSIVLHLKPFAIQTMYFTPSEVIGDQDCQLHMTLNAEPKNLGSMVVALSSSNPSVLRVPATANFMGQNAFVLLTTNAVHQIKIITVTATLDGVQKKVRFTVNP